MCYCRVLQFALALPRIRAALLGKMDSSSKRLGYVFVFVPKCLVNIVIRLLVLPNIGLIIG